MSKYYVRIFEGLTPVLDPGKRFHHGKTVDATQLFYLETPDENIWGNKPHEFEIFANSEGIGFRQLHPQGYSSYTYDPEVEERFYKGATWDWFKRNALDEDQRNMISAADEEKLKDGLTEEQKRE